MVSKTIQYRFDRPGRENRPSMRGISSSILIVDDNTDAAETMTMMLESMGAKTRTAFDGAEAIDHIRTWQPQIVIMDLGMPLLTGWDVARIIRQEISQEMLLIALSGWGREVDIRRSMDSGFDAHFVKPAEWIDLLKVID